MSGLFVARVERGGSGGIEGFSWWVREARLRSAAARVEITRLQHGYSSTYSSFRLQPARPSTHHLKALHPFLRGACGVAQPLLTQHVSCFKFKLDEKLTLSTRSKFFYKHHFKIIQHFPIKSGTK